MLQGDEPLIKPQMIVAAVNALIAEPSTQVVNLMGNIHTDDEFRDVNEVKVVVDQNGFALYFFSRDDPIPLETYLG